MHSQEKADEALRSKSDQELYSKIPVRYVAQVNAVQPELRRFDLSQRASTHVGNLLNRNI